MHFILKMAIKTVFCAKQKHNISTLILIIKYEIIAKFYLNMSNIKKVTKEHDFHKISTLHVQFHALY